MKAFAGLVIRALLIAMVFASVGLLVNQAADDRRSLGVRSAEERWSWLVSRYSSLTKKRPQSFWTIRQLFLWIPRKCSDYAKSHVRGAVCLPPDDVEQRFPSVEPLIPSESRVILYCYGPECDMAEKVGEFLAQMGYKNMLIMSSGFPAWVKAKYPVDGRSEKDTAIEDPQDIFMEDEIAEG